MADLTWDDLDAMVEGDPFALRDKAWAEVFKLRTQERAARQLRVQAQAQLAKLRAQRDALLRRLDERETEADRDGERDLAWIQTSEVRALLGADTTPDRLAWISEAGETAAAERQARYQETGCARRYHTDTTPEARQ